MTKGKRHKSKKYEQYYGELYHIEKWRKRARKWRESKS